MVCQIMVFFVQQPQPVMLTDWGLQRWSLVVITRLLDEQDFHVRIKGVGFCSSHKKEVVLMGWSNGRVPLYSRNTAIISYSQD